MKPVQPTVSMPDLSQPCVMGILNVTPDSFYADSRRTTREAVEHSTRPYERLRLLVRYRRNLRTGECKGYTLVRIIKAFDFETFRERLHAAIERESRAWAGIDHAAWLQEMREG